MKRMRYVFAFLMSVLSLSSFALEPHRGQGLTPVVLQLKWQHAFQFAGYYAAKAQGYYQEAGLEVQFLEGKPGVDAVQEVLSGRADFGVGTTELLLNRHQGAPVSILGVVYQHSPLQLVVLEDSGIFRPSDLINKRVMLEKNASPEVRAFLNVELSTSPDIFGFLKQSGIVQDRYQSVEHTHTLDAFLAKEVEAMSVYTTNQLFELNEKNVRYRILNPQMSGVDFYGDNVFTTDYLIQSNPSLVNRFYHASMKGWRYALDHPEEIATLIYQDYSQRMSLEHLRYEAQVTAQLMQANLIQPGYMNLDRWRHIVGVYQRLGDLPETFNIEQMLHQEQKDKIHSLTQQLLWAVIGFSLASVFGVMLWYFYRQARGSLQRLDTLLEHVPTAVIVVDVHGVIQSWNRGAERIFGWTEAEAYHENILALLVPRAQQSQISDLFTRVHHQRGIEYSKNANVHKNGQGLICEWVNTPYRDEHNQLDYILCMAYDATKLETWSELMRAKEEAEQTSSARVTFLMNISRDLQRPFARILQEVHLLEDARNSEPLKMISQTADKGLSVARQLMDVSLLESGQLQLYPSLFSMQAIADQLAWQMKERCSAKGLSLHYDYASDAPKILTTDEKRLQQVLHSLLDNAVQHTKQGEVGFRLFVVDAGFRVEISDTGKGMDKQTQEQLFHYVSRMDAPCCRHAESVCECGGGLSLVLAKSLISAMGGSLSFSSHQGEGSRFCITLPLSKML